jgi:hypothetical protein
VLDVTKIKESTTDQAERIMAMEKLIMEMAKKMKISDLEGCMHS